MQTRFTTLEQAIIACAGGDRAALRFVYDAEAKRMLGVALRMVKRRSVAEDIVQDAFLSVWNKAASFDPASGAGRSWLYAILRNRALNVMRGERRVELSGDPVGEDQAADAPSPEDILLSLSDQSALRRCLEKLDDVRRRMLLMAYTEGLSHGDLAERLGLPLGTVKSWIRRSMLSLRECLG